MAELLERHDPYSEREWDEFERLAVSIINQQLSTASAAAVKERVVDVLDGEVMPEAVLDADEDELADAGLSSMKIDYLQNAAEAFQEKDFTREGLADHTIEEVIDALTEIKGVGEWTAHMYLMFVLEREDVLPLGDLAIRNGIEQVYGDTGSGGGEDDETGDSEDGELTRVEMREIAETWRPYRSIAARYIWAEYENGE